MLRSIFFISVLLITFQSTFSQEKIFEDNCNDNSKRWRVRNDSNFLVTVKDGVLHLEKFQQNFTSRGCLWYSKVIPGFNTINNFSVTFYAKFVSGGDIFDAIDLLWGDMKKDATGRTNSNIYQLNFFLRGEVRLNHFNIKWDYPPNISIRHLLSKDFDAHSMNKYELIQKDGFVYFKINEVEVLKQKRDPIAGNSIGFQQCMKSAWEIDKIEIRQQPPAFVRL